MTDEMYMGIVAFIMSIAVAWACLYAMILIFKDKSKKISKLYGVLFLFCAVVFILCAILAILELM